MNIDDNYATGEVYLLKMTRKSMYISNVSEAKSHQFSTVYRAC